MDAQWIGAGLLNAGSAVAATITAEPSTVSFGGLIEAGRTGPIQTAVPPSKQSEELIALDDGLNALDAIDPRRARIVELRFFAGLDVSAPCTPKITGLRFGREIRSANGSLHTFNSHLGPVNHFRHDDRSVSRLAARGNSRFFSAEHVT